MMVSPTHFFLTQTEQGEGTLRWEDTALEMAVKMKGGGGGREGSNRERIEKGGKKGGAIS